MTQRCCSATLWKCQDSNAVAAVHSWTAAETANLLEYFACTRISRGDVGSFLPLKMNVDYELWQVAQRWAEGPRGDFIGAGMKAAGSEGQLSLFLFQLDRIGTGPEREETRSWAQAAGTGLIKPVTAGEASQLTYDGKSHTLFTTALGSRALTDTAGGAKNVSSARTRSDSTFELLLIIPLQWARFRVHLELCVKTLPSGSGENLNWQQLSDLKLLIWGAQKMMLFHRENV